MERSKLNSSRFFRGKVLADIMKDEERDRGSGAWLNKSIPFDQDHSLDEKHIALANQLFIQLQIKRGYNIEQKFNDLQVLLANLFHRGKKPIHISLNQNDWKKTRYNKVSYFIISLLDILHKENYITMDKGYFIEEGSRMTRISATDKLLEYCPEYNTAVVWNPSELVILRDNKKKPIDYKDTAETWRVRSILKLVNEVNNKSDIRYGDYKLQTYLRAVYNEKFTWYGRLHTKGYRHYQGLSGKQREEITINGNKVVEPDFSGLHPFLLYAEVGIQYLGDPYLVVEKNPIARPFLKQILLCMLNSNDFTSAERAANYWLYHNSSEKEKLATINITRAKPLMNKFIEAHQPISHYFCNGKDTGMRIMNKDAKIALDVVNHFAKQNIPILAIHDSFIVEEQYRDELCHVMKSIYKKHTGMRIKVK